MLPVGGGKGKNWRKAVIVVLRVRGFLFRGAGGGKSCVTSPTKKGGERSSTWPAGLRGVSNVQKTRPRGVQGSGRGRAAFWVGRRRVLGVYLGDLCEIDVWGAENPGGPKGSIFEKSSCLGGFRQMNSAQLGIGASSRAFIYFLKANGAPFASDQKD